MQNENNPTLAITEDSNDSYDGKKIRQMAKTVLKTYDVRLRSICAYIIMLALMVGSFIVIVAPGSALQLWMGALHLDLMVGLIGVLMMVILVGGIVFVLLPLLTGITAFCVHCYEDGEKQPPMDLIFRPLSSVKMYRRVLLYVWGNLWRTLLSLLGPIVLIQVTVIIANVSANDMTDTTKFALFLGCGILSAVILLIALFWVGNNMLTPYLLWSREDLSVSQCRQMSRQTMRGRRMPAMAFHIFFIAMSLISLLSVGVLFVLYVLPLWTYSYMVWSKQLLTEYDT